MGLSCWSFLMGSWLECLLPEAGLSCPVVPATCPVVFQDLCCLSASPVVFQQPKLTRKECAGTDWQQALCSSLSAYLSIN